MALLQKGDSIGLVERLADQVGGKAKTEAAFGTPFRVGQTVIVPISKIGYGFGAGGGQDSEHEQSGGGGGGGARITPMGYLEIRDDHAEFKRILDSRSVVAILLGVGFGTWLALRGVRSALGA